MASGSFVPMTDGDLSTHVPISFPLSTHDPGDLLKSNSVPIISLLKTGQVSLPHSEQMVVFLYGLSPALSSLLVHSFPATRARLLFLQPSGLYPCPPPLYPSLATQAWFPDLMHMPPPSERATFTSLSTQAAITLCPLAVLYLLS